MGRRSRSSVHGVLVVDKPRGPTSHDVVQIIRRALHTRAVGHAGTLDPMATGVLVVAVGEATKLVRWLTADDKVYEATVALGAETDTLDAEGKVVDEMSSEGVDLGLARAAATAFVGTYLQRPPLFSAIRVDGERLHEKARRGEKVDVPEREVTVRELEIRSADERAVDLRVVCAKGFYVRALGRDLARALGTCGHLSALRRTKSGAFSVEDAVDMATIEGARDDDTARAALAGRLVSLVDACGAMPKVVLDERGVRDARHGRQVRAAGAPPDGTEPVALLDPGGALVAVARSCGDHLRVVRGFAGQSGAA